MKIFDAESNLVILIIAGGLILLSVLLSFLNKNKSKRQVQLILTATISKKVC